jgi:hypothetical protein
MNRAGTAGVIRVDGADDDGDVNARVGFQMRHALRPDPLREGDRVEFALVPRPTTVTPKTVAVADRADEESSDADRADDSGVDRADDSGVGRADETVGVDRADEAVGVERADEIVDRADELESSSSMVAVGVLRLGSSSSESKAGKTARPESRFVNSTLLQAMRQVGASAVVKSRMAKGPDGSRGFPDGWRASTRE